MRICLEESMTKFKRAKRHLRRELLCVSTNSNHYTTRPLLEVRHKIQEGNLQERPR